MKKNILKFFSLILLVGTVFSFYSCGSAKKIAASNDEVLVTTFCAGDEFVSTSKAFRFSGIGESMDMMTAKKKAMSEARAGLAAAINTKVKSVTDNYVKSGNFNNKEELLRNYEGLNREVVDQTLSGVKVICEKMTKTKAGNYKSYICVELSGEEILKTLNNKMSNNETLKVDYNYEKFKKTFEDEMSKVGN